jgi:hypothetical protein
MNSQQKAYNLSVVDRRLMKILTINNKVWTKGMEREPKKKQRGGERTNERTICQQQKSK